MLSTMQQSHSKTGLAGDGAGTSRTGTPRSTQHQSGSSRLQTGSSRPQTGSTPGTRPTSAAIRQVSAANNVTSGQLSHAAAAITRIGPSRHGRSASPGPAGVSGRASRARSRRAPSPSTMTAWASTASSRRGSMYSEDDSATTPHPPPAEVQAWAAFETSIKEIADDTIYFTQKPQTRNFRSSDAFKQVLTDINYVPVVELTTHDDDDVSLLSFRPGSAAGDGSTAPSGADADWADRQSVLSIADDDCVSISRTSGLGRKSPGVHFRDRGCSGGDYASSMAGRLSPAEEEPEPESVPDGKAFRPLLPVADIFTDQKDMRDELYQRYLHRPETWTSGLTRHLHKTVTRERLPSSKTWHTTQIFRPKSAIVNGTRFDNTSVRFKRVQSALPSLRTNSLDRRGSSARYMR